MSRTRAAAVGPGARTLLASVALTCTLGAACSSAGEVPAASSVATTAAAPGSTAGSRGGTTPGTTPGSTPGSTPGTTPGTALRTGACPSRTDLVVATRAGRRPLQLAAGKADITANQSAKVVLADYDVPDADVHGIFNPTNLTGDQLALSLYVTSRTGPLSPTDYLSVGANPDAPNQLNNIAAYSAAGREIVGGVSKADQKVTVTKVDSSVICGTVDTNEATGVWVARII